MWIGLLFLLLATDAKKKFTRPKIEHRRQVELTFKRKTPDWVGWEKHFDDDDGAPSLSDIEEGGSAISGGSKKHASRGEIEDIDDTSGKGTAATWYADQEVNESVEPADCETHKSCEQLLIQEIKTLQNPKDCGESRRRFLFLEFEGSEGVGSTIGMIAEGLAEGLHSNRTTIYGPIMPTMMGLSFMGGVAEGFPSDDPCGKDAVSALDCYIEPISSCSLKDALKHRKSFKSFVKNVYDDRKMFKAMESRRGSPALMTAPRRFRHLTGANVWWTRVLLQYVFRLKPNIVKEMEALRLKTGTRHPTVGVHIRHGDLSLRFEYGEKAGTRAYQNRPFFDVATYFEHVKDAVETGKIPMPKTVYVASDSTLVKQAVEVEKLDAFWNGGYDDDAKEGDAEEDGGEESTGEDPLTNFVLLDRYRSKHGAHTSATLMALPHSVKEQLSKDSKRDRALRFRKMLQEAIEDIWMLSKCDYFFGTGSSHFTALATYLREGKDSNPAYPSFFLDSEGLVSGHFCPGLFHGTINGTSRLPNPHERHHIMHRRFLDRLHVAEDLMPPNVFHFDTEQAVYTIPSSTFDSEASRWVDPRRSRMWEWAVTDAATLRNPKRLMDRIVSLINDGASLDEFWSYGIVCTGWRHAKELLSRVRKGKLQLAAGDDMLRQMEDIVLGNIKVAIVLVARLQLR